MAKNSERPVEFPRDGFADVNDAARFLAVGRTSVYAMIGDGRLPSVQIGRCRRIPWRLLHKLAESTATSAI